MLIISRDRGAANGSNKILSLHQPSVLTKLSRGNVCLKLSCIPSLHLVSKLLLSPKTKKEMTRFKEAPILIRVKT